ncbi:head GIN domain-containing protein [Hellea balneolensis]|uniref:head GIN domain-containing protein n=1 Tax=Hellea balneolensis TaxID=287478 RepID=UPI0003FC11EF|nr:head GIN domain-containing protein [Hellea balneolensis]
MQKHILLNALKAASAIAILLASTSIVSAHEVDDKDRIEETHDIIGFDKIRITGVYELEVQVGEDFSVFTSGKHKDVEGMKVYRKGKTLVLAQDEDRQDKSINLNGRKNKNNSGIRAVISLPSLEGVDITGIGSGEIKGIDSKDFDIEVAGISDMELSGSCGQLDVDMAGLGELRAEDLECENVDVDLAGMGEISVYASESVSADAAGMGSIEVYGNPKDIEKSKSFMASVKIK